MVSKEYYTKKFNQYLDATGEVGHVEMVTPPLAYVSGLPNASLGEVLYFESGTLGEILALDRDLVEVLMFSDEPLDLGSRVSRSDTKLSVPVTTKLLGLSIDPLGEPIYDNNSLLRPDKYLPIERDVLGIAHREKINEPFLTGVTLIDLLIPLGKGQRELVIGDRKTGKTTFLLQAMLKHAQTGGVCIYAGVGKKKSDLRKVEAFISQKGIQDSCVVVSTSLSDPLGMIYIAPYAAMSIAEYFRDLGYDVFIIFDDLTNHAKAYRELSLLGKRFPGRGSYPGDIFYLHSRLLERGGNYTKENGGTAITSLPVAETVEGDISGYIQTNLMSITDGHIYFDTDMFKEGRRPAINNFLSVTRVGRQTQTKLRWSVNREVSSFLVLYQKTLSFIHFGAELNEGIRSTLSMGEKILAYFDQPMGKIYDIKVQLITFSLVWTGIVPVKNGDEVKTLMQVCSEYYRTNDEFKSLVDSLMQEDEDLNNLLGVIGQNSQKINKYFSNMMTKKVEESNE